MLYIKILIYVFDCFNTWFKIVPKQKEATLFHVSTLKRFWGLMTLSTLNIVVFAKKDVVYISFFPNVRSKGPENTKRPRVYSHLKTHWNSLFWKFLIHELENSALQVWNVQGFHKHLQNTASASIHEFLMYRLKILLPRKIFYYANVKI